MPRTADWFASLTKKAQKEYIAKHPNSKYAKGAKPAAKAAAKAESKFDAAKFMVKSYAQSLREAKSNAKTLPEGVAKRRALKEIDGLQKKLDVAKAAAKKPVSPFKGTVGRTNPGPTAEKLKEQMRAAKAKLKAATTNREKAIASAGINSVKVRMATLKEAKSKATAGASKVTTMSMTGKTKKPVSATAVKTAHDKKRATDKNKVVAKTPSARTKAKPTLRGLITDTTVHKIKGKTPAETNLKQRIAGLRLSLQMQKTTTPEYKRRKAQYDKLRAQLKAMK